MMESKKNDDQTYQRFNVLHRLLHIVIVFNFSMLVITGFLLRFSAFEVAQTIALLIGGGPGLGALHRFSASFLYLGIMVHVLWLFYYKLVLKGSLVSPSSLAPRATDFKDLYQNIRYIFGKGRPPLFNRFSYLQKVDYWAIMLGMQSMGITGLIMWYPEYFSTFLPGYVINVANHFHFHEAVLAVMYIAIVHMFDTHLAPEVFPMETSIFTGKISLYRMQEEHPGELKENNIRTH